MGWGEVIGGPKAWARDLGLAVGIGLVLAFLGPFGSYATPLQTRILISVAIGVAGSAVMWPLVRLIQRLGARAGLPELFTIAAALVVTAAPVSVTSRLVSMALNPHPRHIDWVTQYFAVLAVVLPFGGAVIAVQRLVDRRSASAVPDAAAPPRLLERVPARLGREVIALQAEDHYVRVYTPLGSDLILMRFADAIAEADGLDGLRVHRSWWVVRDAVAAARTEGRRAVLTLTGGLEVPVTRETVPDIRRADWL